MSDALSVVGTSAARTFSVVEPLEDRRLLCGTGTSAVAAAALHSGVTPSAVRAPLTAAATKTTAAATTPKKPVVKKPVPKPKPKGPQPTVTPSLIHDYVGTLKTKGVFGIGKKTVAFEMNITGQTLTGISGTATIDGQTITGTLTGKLLTTRAFVYRISGKGVSFAMTGTTNKTGLGIAGTASVALASASIFKITGGFSAIAK